MVLSIRVQVLVVLVAAAAAGAAMVLLPQLRSGEPAGTQTAASTQAEASLPEFHPTKEQWTKLVLEPVALRSFVPEQSTDGKIAVDDDHNTPIFSPYSGRVTRLLAQPGEHVARGQPLFAVEAVDMVQAQNDFLTARAALNKAKAQLGQAQLTEKRQRQLYQAQAAALKDWQQAQTDLVGAQNDARSSEVALQAVRNRLRILGKSDREIAAFESTGTISPDTPIYAPIAGVVIQRKIGPGQYLSAGASDPAYVIGDLGTVWLIANVREGDAPKIKIGQSVEVKVLAFPDRIFSAQITYVAAGVDPNTRRLPVRAEVANPDEALRPEMFARFTILVGPKDAAPAVPREAIVHEGDGARVWVAAADGSLRLRRIRLGLVNGNMVQVMEGLVPGERVVTRGGLFIDRAATSGVGAS